MNIGAVSGERDDLRSLTSKYWFFLNPIAVGVKEKTVGFVVLNITFPVYRFCLDKGDRHPIKNAHAFALSIRNEIPVIP